jgi:hypothetical protein
MPTFATSPSQGVYGMAAVPQLRHRGPTLSSRASPPQSCSHGKSGCCPHRPAPKTRVPANSLEHRPGSVQVPGKPIQPSAPPARGRTPAPPRPRAAPPAPPPRRPRPPWRRRAAATSPPTARAPASPPGDTDTRMRLFFRQPATAERSVSVSRTGGLPAPQPGEQPGAGPPARATSHSASRRARAARSSGSARESVAAPHLRLQADEADEFFSCFQ